ncbi:MAG: ArgE/DapE family deacylase, partial [Candidatus Lokiarchaeota archaeon]|nr:ArgE/DapE family deacylase [Candidatus Lokiarchaeota archaeon]
MVDLNKIYEEVDNLDRERIMDLMRSLISIDTSVPPGNSYRKYIDTISPYFKELKYDLEEVIVPEELINQILLPLEGPRINLVATKEFGIKKNITFCGHMDVVPATNEGSQKWKFPPFEATMIKSGKIYGRGVGDNKGPMVCLIIALQIIDKLNLRPKYNIRVLNCTDEEIGVYPGIRYLTEHGYVQGTVFSIDYSIEPIILMGAAGELEIEVETIGRSSHSGLSLLGVNALEEMVPILVELMKLKKIVESRQSKDITGFPDPKTKEKCNLSPLFNLDIIKSGEKVNIIPDICKLTIDRRIIPDETIEEVTKEIIDAIELGKTKSNALDVKISFRYSYPPLKVDINSPEIKRISKVIQLVHKIPEEKIRKTGMTLTFDVGFVAQILKTQEIILRGVATAGSNTHGVNETIRLKDIKKFI